MDLIEYFKDFLTIASCVAVVALVAVGMFGEVTGGGLPRHIAFPWHPVLMSLAFPCLMVLGRLSYLSNPDYGPKAPECRRSLHGLIMVCAVLAALAGYRCIFIAHLPAKNFFGYDFKKGEWAEYRRVIHGWLGYLLLALMLAQAIFGARKWQVLKTKGQRTLTFHGTLGKVILLLGAVEVLVATSFWGWSLKMKAFIYVLTTYLGLFSAFWPKPTLEQQDSDSESLLD